MVDGLEVIPVKERIISAQGCTAFSPVARSNMGAHPKIIISFKPQDKQVVKRDHSPCFACSKAGRHGVVIPLRFGEPSCRRPPSVWRNGLESRTKSFPNCRFAVESSVKRLSGTSNSSALMPERYSRANPFLKTEAAVGLFQLALRKVRPEKSRLLVQLIRPLVMDLICAPPSIFSNCRLLTGCEEPKNVLAKSHRSLRPSR